MTSRFAVVAIVVAAAAAYSQLTVAQTVTAQADSGTTDAGVVSKAVGNIAANDLVNGAPATLGTGGNATISKVGQWHAGITLNTATGLVSTAAALPAGQYAAQYQLCDTSAPPDCATAPVNVTVISAAVVALPVTGVATAGATSRPIANLLANDTVNGSPAVLGSSGNATVAKSGSWSAGIGLNTSNGSVSVSGGVAPGTYGVAYKLCDHNSPPLCSTAAITIQVNPAAVNAASQTGAAAFGIASMAFVNITSSDSINGGPVTLGASGNATIAAVGTWPGGIGLHPYTGAISTSTAVPPGTYGLQYRLCDKSSPPHCASATDTLTVTPAATEVQVSTVSMMDIEFDWGRDGIPCPTCNYGQGNARFNWTDQSGNLWLGYVDQNTGAFTPETGNAVLVDSSGYYYSVFGNGAEWAFSTQNGNPTSQLVFARHPPGQTGTSSNAGAAFATQGPDGWSADFFPGTAPGDGLVATANPLASQCLGDPVSLAYFYGLPQPQNLYWEPLSDAPGTAPVLTPFVGAYADHRSGQKPDIRWTPCTRTFVFVGAAPPDDTGTVYDQVFWYDIDTQVGQQLTFDSGDHTEAYMFQAPEFNDNYVLLTISNDSSEVDVYEQTGTNANGSPALQLVNSIFSTDPAEPYILGAEPFIHCTPQCHTYIFMQIRSAAPQRSSGETANGLAVAGIDPSSPLFKILVPEAATFGVQRTDLEYYITANGPYIYYNRNILPTKTSPQILGDRYYVDTQLGAPSGPCVGSSAEGGMLPGC